jgi:hypothetical protein
MGRRALHRPGTPLPTRRLHLLTLLAALLLLPAVPAAGQGSEPVTDPNTGVMAWPSLDRQPGQHVEGEVLYAQVPPVGGPHNPVWQSCGVYSAPVYNWHAIHSLEHGAVWITYDPNLPAADVQQLQAIANQGYIIVSPYPGLPAPVVVSSWSRQVRLDGVSDPRLQQFIVDFRRDPATAPEPNATCSMGITDTMPAGELPQQQPSIVSGTPDEVAAAEASATETPVSSPDVRGEYKEKH